VPLGRQDLESIFENFGDSERRLSLEGFQKVFFTQTAASVEETFKDLRKMGFNENLDYVGPPAR
jgi:hypothetical protein